MRSKRMIGDALKSSLVLLPILLIACAGMQRSVEPADRISLRAGGPHTGSWESSSISLDYQYSKKPGTIELSAQPRAKKQFAKLTVWALFVDAKGNVLDKQAVYSVGSRSGRPGLENKFEIPPATAYLSFSSRLVSPVMTPRDMYHPPSSR